MNIPKHYINSVNLKLVVTIVALSLILTLVATGIRSYQIYQNEIHNINQRMTYIEKSYIPSIIKSLWELDKEHIQIQLEGLLQLSYMQYVTVRSIDSAVIAAAGTPPSEDGIVKDFELSYTYKGQEINLGSLKAVADTRVLKTRIWTELYLTLLTEGLKILLLSICILFLIHLLVMRHLKTMAEYARNLNIQENFTPLILNRRSSQMKGQDEFDTVVSASNETLKNLKKSFDDLAQSNERLEREMTERLQVEGSLKTALDQYQMILQTTRDGFWINDLCGKILEVNDAICKLLGYSREELVGMRIQDVEAVEKPEDTERHIQAIVKDKGSFFESHHRRKDGSLVDVSVSIGYLPMDGGRIFAFIRDITEHKRAVELLHETDVNLREAQEIARIGRWELDPFANHLTWSDGIFALFEVNRETFSASYEAFLSFIHPDDRALVDQVYRESVANKTSYECEHRLLMNDDRIKWVSEIGRTKYDDAGRPIRSVGTVQDITERKKAEEKLARLNQQNELILSSAAEGILGLDLQGNHAFVNPAAARMLGYRAEELLGRPGHSTWHHTKPDGSPYPREECQIHAACRDGVVHRESNEVFWRKDGVSFPVEYASTPIYEHGRAVGAVVTFADITERKQAEKDRQALQKRLQRAEKMEALGQLAGGVAHDLNNVLGVSTVYSELLQEKIPEKSPLRKYVDNILSSTQKGAAIIEDLLTLARRGVTVSEVMNLNGIVSNFVITPEYEKIQAYHPHVTFRTECRAELLNIKGSPLHLEKTLMNLVSNAAESISEKGEVTIRTENRYLDKPIRGYDEVKEGDYAVLTVSDTGMGILAENIGKIFEPFYTKKTMGRSGTGLGLAIVWGAVKDHHGYIDLHTEVGGGTTFTLYFPVTQEEPITVLQKKVPIERYMGAGESVLVVDDIAEQREIAARCLTRLGYEVRLVSSGEEAVEYLREHTADILMLDMIMAPGMDGLETYERILEVNPMQKAILVSGFSETDRVRKAQELGAGAYVKKPYVMEKIGVAVRDELRKV